MKYCSTRGKVRGLSFKEALFSGYTADGGLFVPESVPKLDPRTIENLVQSKASYPSIVYNIVRLFVAQEEIPDDVLESCIKKAYSKFNIPEVVGITECKTRSGSPFKVAELYHGPTASFKDYALSLVGQFMQHFLSQSKENVIILVGTSGDTGSAAIKAVEGLKGIDIIVLYPDGKISSVQELQMNSSKAENVHVFAVEGTSDDLDVPIRKSFPGDGLCSINSINWARIMLQIAHFVYLYVHKGTALDIFVPTGAAGNVAGGVLASLMGIPIKLFVATNENDNVNAFLNKGELQMGGNVISTPACAMDIRYPYNLERVIYFMSNSTELTSGYMRTCEQNEDGIVIISNELRNKIKQRIPNCRTVTTKEIHETIQWCWKLNKYMICPHTATAVAHLSSSGADRGAGKVVVISTASPQKFSEAINDSGISKEEWNGNELRSKLELQVQPDRSMTKDSDWYQILQKKISTIRHNYL